MRSTVGEALLACVDRNKMETVLVYVDKNKPSHQLLKTVNYFLRSALKKAVRTSKSLRRTEVRTCPANTNIVKLGFLQVPSLELKEV